MRGTRDYPTLESEPARVHLLFVDFNPDHFRARVLLGKIDFLQGDYQGAADELHTALSLGSGFDVAYSLALADLELKKTALAIVLFSSNRRRLGQSTLPPTESSPPQRT
ncbi:MAG: tetratricopeptide repeat protein [Terriglobales bacterium]